MSSKQEGMFTSKTSKNALTNLVCPDKSIDEAIDPETWTNIPICLVKAFNADVANQLYLEKFCNAIVSKVGSLEKELHLQRRELEANIEKSCELVRRDIQKEVADMEELLNMQVTQLRIDFEALGQSVGEER